MPKSVEFCQLVARAISHTTWDIPRIRDGDQSSAASPRDNNFSPPAKTFSQMLSQVLIQCLQWFHPIAYRVPHHQAPSGDYLKGKVAQEMANIWKGNSGL